MKPTNLVTTVVLATISLSLPVQAENLSHLSQLLSTKKCPQCDLSGAGFVMANLSGAQLGGANLSQANLSQANLSGADLSGADLTGASLYGANLSGANLSGANLNGTDIRDAYLVNANLKGVNLNTAYVQGAIGIPTYAGTAEQFYSWGIAEGERGNYKGAIQNFNVALSINPNLASAYLARGLAQYRLGNEAGATQDAQIAAKLFETQKNTSGYEASQNFIKGIEAVQNAANHSQDPGPDLGNLVRGLASIVMQFLLR